MNADYWMLRLVLGFIAILILLLLFQQLRPTCQSSQKTSNTDSVTTHPARKR